ncbi:AAA family ATPase [Dickeya dadantii]|uniref:AAA family ATPase n=1 Tax=Dickeya dadantii TaxID=204038 RepID=UPI003D6D7E8D
MLIRFSVENYKSFRDRVEFSMVSGKVRNHPTHVVKAASTSDISVLKVGVIYGANASGKSNIIKAMKHAQNMIVNGSKAGTNLPYFPFKLDDDFEKKPSRFEFEFKIKGKNYAYGFSANQKIITEEWLYETNKKGDMLVYERNNTVDFNFENIKFKSKDDEQFLNFIARGTRENCLFLYQCFEGNVLNNLQYITKIADAFEWFKFKLQIIFPNSKYSGLEFGTISDEINGDLITDTLKNFDTGVSKLVLKEVSSLDEIKLPDNIKNRILEDLKSNETVVISTPKNKRYKIELSDDGDIKAHQLMTAHKNKNGEDVYFELNQESDGTQRLFDIIPGLIELMLKDKVYIIDEIDRSLHPKITKTFIELFSKNTIEKDSQLIVTTHETGLLDFSLIRRDEVWFTEKNNHGVSRIYSLEEFQPRFDNDIRKGYLVGRFGGVPKIKTILPDIDDSKEE